MPGIKAKTPTAPSALGGIVDVIDEVEESGEVPDPSPYQSVSYFETTGLGGQVVRHEQKNWNKRGMQKWLRACPKSYVFIPLDPANDGDDPKTARPFIVRIDGIPIEVPKGRSVRVARPVAEIIEQSQRKYRTAQSQGLDTYTIKADDDMGKFLPELGDAGGVPASAWRE